MKIKIILYLFLFSLVNPCVISYSQLADSLRIDYSIIDSHPQNAEVYVNGELSGLTPFRFLRNEIKDANIVIKLTGFYDYSFRVTNGDTVFSKSVIMLPKSRKNLSTKLVIENEPLDFNKPRKVIPIALSALLTTASGVAAYYFKQLAIEQNDSYYNTLDPSYINKKKKYDLISGISVGVFELGFASFFYFLLSDN